MFFVSNDPVLKSFSSRLKYKELMCDDSQLVTVYFLSKVLHDVT